MKDRAVSRDTCCFCWGRAGETTSKWRRWQSGDILVPWNRSRAQGKAGAARRRRRRSSDSSGSGRSKSESEESSSDSLVPPLKNRFQKNPGGGAALSRRCIRRGVHGGHLRRTKVKDVPAGAEAELGSEVKSLSRDKFIKY